MVALSVWFVLDRNIKKWFGEGVPLDSNTLDPDALDAKCLVPNNLELCP